MQISFLDLSSSKFIFIQATKCVVQRDSWLKKVATGFFFFLLTSEQSQNFNISKLSYQDNLILISDKLS